MPVRWHWHLKPAALRMAPSLEASVGRVQVALVKFRVLAGPVSRQFHPNLHTIQPQPANIQNVLNAVKSMLPGEHAGEDLAGPHLVEGVAAVREDASPISSRDCIFAERSL